MKGLQRGRLTIAVASTANYFAPRLLATFCQQHGEVKVSLDVTNREQLLKSLVENRADLVIMGNHRRRWTWWPNALWIIRWW